MKEITAIKKIGKGSRYSVYVDGEFFAVIEAEILAKFKIKLGKISDEELDNVLIKNGDYASFDKALSKIERGPATEKMVRDYLRQKGYKTQSIDKTITKLYEYNYLDDSSYAENFIRTYSSLKGPQKLRFELIKKGVDSEIIDQKLEEILSEDEVLDSCISLAKKYLKNKAYDAKTKQKLFANLTSKGFKFDVIKKALNAVLEENNEGWN